MLTIIEIKNALIESVLQLPDILLLLLAHPAPPLSPPPLPFHRLSCPRGRHRPPPLLSIVNAEPLMTKKGNCLTAREEIELTDLVRNQNTQAVNRCYLDKTKQCAHFRHIQLCLSQKRQTD